jgi:hypothetical protein
MGIVFQMSIIYFRNQKTYAQYIGRLNLRSQLVHITYTHSYLHGYTYAQQ